jgi:PAS domain S-box-containing protein
MRKRLAELPSSSAILYAILLADAAGVPHEQERALEILHSEANAPIFGVFDSQLGRGIVGGPLYPTQEVSRESVRLALRILGGESPSTMQPLSLGPATPVYDWRELKRWGISESRLAPGSTVQFRPPSLWELYKWYIVGALIIIAIQTAIIADLLLERARRRRAQSELSESEARLQLAMESARFGYWAVDLSTGEVKRSETLERIFGLTTGSMAGTQDAFLAVVHPEDREIPLRHVERCIETLESTDIEYRIVRPDGAIRWLASRGRAIPGPDGRVARVLGMSADITERKEAEEALRESEARFRTMADTAPVMIWMSGEDKLCHFLNKGWLDFTGRTLDQELGNGWAEGVHREDFDRCLEVYDNSFDARQEFTMEYRLRRLDGEYRWVVDTGVPRFAPDGKFLGYIGCATDITERKQIDEMLKQERAFLRQVIDIDPNLIFAKDREGRFTLVNQAVAEVYGTTVEGLVGKTDADFSPNAEEVEFFRRTDLEVMDTLQERFINEEHITDASGKTRWLQTVKRPIVDDSGLANHVLGSATDITDRKEAELEAARQRAELAHIARVSTMGELAASLAHELNQPLTAILSNAQAAQRFLNADTTDLKEVGEILEDIVQDNGRASEVIHKLRALVKKEDSEFSTLDLAGVLSDVVMFVRSDAVLHNVSVSLDLTRELQPVRGDKVQLQQVVLNLLLNAFDAMKDCPANERTVVLRADIDGTDMVRAAVRDRGIGLGRDKLDKIFQPFYTTKRDGLGMGLSISRSIIEAHGGRLWAENNLDRGATFYFTLPVSSVSDHRSPTHL